MRHQPAGEGLRHLVEVLIRGHTFGEKGRWASARKSVGGECNPAAHGRAERVLWALQGRFGSILLIKSLVTGVEA